MAPDTGDIVLDDNVDKFRRSPMEPAIQAVLHFDSQYNFSNLDIVSDKQPLASLLNMAYSKEEETPIKAFTFYAQVVGNILVLTRGDGKSVIEDNNKFRGYRKNFDSKYLKKPASIQDPGSHFHLTSYKIDDIKILIRHKVDAHLKFAEETPSSNSSSYKETTSGLRVYSAGSLLPSFDLVEINTFKNRGNDTGGSRLDEKQREAWLSRCGFFFRAGYEEKANNGGRPEQAELSDRRAFFPSWRREEGNYSEPSRSVLNKYYNLLSTVIGAVRATAAKGEDKLFTVTYHVADGLLVSRGSDGRALPDKLCERMQEPK